MADNGRYLYEEEVASLEELLTGNLKARLDKLTALNTAFQMPRTEFNSDVTIDPETATVWVAKALTGNTVATLPAAADWDQAVLVIRRDQSENSGNTLTVDTLDEGDVSLPGPGDGIWVQSDGTNWTVISAVT